MPEDVKPKYPGAKCGECPYLTGSAFVPPQFPEKPPKLMVLGEAPGQNEAKTGVPFTGPSGQLLTSVLDHHGIDHGSVIKSNTVLCRKYGPTEKPPKKAIECCSDRLHSEIQESGIEYILAVGNTAASAVLAEKGTITKLRVGAPKTYKYNDNIKVVASVHPAFCLRSPDNFPTFVKDVGKIVNTKTSTWKPPTYKVFDDPEIARKAMKQLLRHTDRAVIDIEAGIEKDISFEHPEDYQMLCVGFAYDKGKAIVIGEHAMADPGTLELIQEYFATKTIGGWNVKFDLRGLAPLIGIQKASFDGMLKSRSLDERPGYHKLKVNAIERLGAPPYDDSINKYVPRGGNYANIPRKILYEYNAYDVCCTWDLDDIFELEMDDRARKEHQFMIDAGNALLHLELAGIRFDHKYNLELSDEYSKEILELEQKMSNDIGYTLNPRSPKQILAYFDSRQMPIEKTDKEYLTELKEGVKDKEILKFIDSLLLHRKSAKTYGTYIKGLSNKTTHDKIYTTYTLNSATSGRLASKNPNMQNIKKDTRIRNQFVVEDEENIFVQCDYSQAEGRTICSEAKDEYLRNIFNDSTRDLFNELTSQIYQNKEVYDSRRKIKSVWYGFCVPLSTRILTRRGWLTYDQVIPSVDETIGYDSSLKRSKWTKITNVLTFKDQDVVRFGDSNIQFETTLNHRWLSEFPNPNWDSLTQKHDEREYSEEFVTTKDIKTEHILQLAKRFNSNSALEITEQEASILGWVLSDGTLKISKVTGVTSQGLLGERQGVIMRIYQSNKNKACVKEIDRVLLNYKNTKYKECLDGQITWNIPTIEARDLLLRAGLLNNNGKYEENDPVQFSLSMSDNQRQAFLHAVSFADRTSKIDQNSDWLTEVIRTVGYLEGYLVKSHIDNSSKLSKSTHYKHWFAKPILTGQAIKKEYVGKKHVWCVETELGTWTMQQNGLTVLTGNSYGRKAPSIAKELDIPLEEAYELVNGFNKIVPATVQWQQSIINSVLSGNDLVTPFGRKRSFYLITKENKTDVINEALSFYPQSIASDICLRALINLVPKLKGIAIPRLTIHDAIVAECKEKDVEEVIHIMRTEMVKSGKMFTNYVDFAVDATTAKRLGDL